MPHTGQAEPSSLASRLAYAGLLPLVGGAALAWLLARPDYLDEHAFVMQGLSAYAATVIAFLGALHWGLTMRQPEPGPLRWGVLPALLAWVGLLMPAYAGLVVHGIVLLVCYGVDRHQYPRLGVGGWLTLRFRCTLLAAMCCFLAAAAT
jgi:hypothetical protein